jgi:hypothetical protein
MPRPKPAPEPRYVKLREAAEYARVPTRTLRDWGAAGLLPLYRIGPRLIQVDLNDIDALRRRIPAGWTGE